MSSSSQAPKLYKCIPTPQGDYRNTFDYTMVEMAMAHNTFIRCANSILYYSSTVEPGTKRYHSFMKYCEVLISRIEHHHDIEEVVLFPYLEKRLGNGAMGDNIQAHRAFEGGLEKFAHYVAKVKADPGSFNLNNFRVSIYGFMDPLHAHLTQEISTLRPERFRAAGISEAELKKTQDDVTAYALKGATLTKDVQLFWANADTANGEWFPPLPKPLSFVMWYILWHVHSDLWEFGCIDKNFKLKPEFAPYEPEMEKV